MANNNNTGKNKKKKIPFTKLIALILVIALLGTSLVSMFAMFLGSFAAVTQEDIDNLKEELEQTKDEQDRLENELDSLEDDASEITGQIQGLDDQISAKETEIELQEQLLENLEVMIETKTLELEQSEADQQQQHDEMLERLRFMAEHGSMSYLEILLSAESFSDFLNRYEIIRQISLHDAELFDELKEATDAVNAQKLELEQNLADEQEIKSSLDDNKAALSEQKASKQNNLKELEDEQSEANAALGEAIDREDDLMEEIRQKAAELAAQQVYVGGTFMWPLPAVNNKITSPYGMRVHPVTGVYKLHTGVDVRASSGTKIYAANAGEIVTSAYSSVWGNYVVINHGGGYTSLYAHMTSRTVSKGDYVERGEIIGYVGSTGYSTGAHLHFEISKDGKTSNPLEHYSGFKVEYV